jgi:hypothetical protein
MALTSTQVASTFKTREKKTHINRKKTQNDTHKSIFEIYQQTENWSHGGICMILDQKVDY